MGEDEVRAARQLREHFPTFCKMLKIKTKKGKVIPFVLNPAQKELWKAIKLQEDLGLPVRIAILKARQLGMSTMVQAYLLWKAVTRPGHNGLVVAHQEDVAGELFGKIELMYDKLPEELYGALESIKDTKKRGKKLQFGGDLNTLLYVDTANNPALGRGQTFQHVHLSELAFYAKPDEIMFGLSQSVPMDPGTTIIVESTANGMGNYFHNMWETAQDTWPKSKTGYYPLFLPWFDDKDYALTPPDDFRLSKAERKIKKRHKLSDEQLAWRRMQIIAGCDGDEEKFQQENPADPEEAFLISGLPYFDRNSLEFYMGKSKEPIRSGYLELVKGKPRMTDVDAEDGWHIWEKPIRGRNYVIGADVAGGGAKDSSAAVVLDLLTHKVVATYHGKLDPHEYAQQLKWMGLAYGKALIAVERNGEGRATVLKLSGDLRYPRMFFHMHEEAWDGGMQTSWGWSTNSRSRPTMIAQLRSLLKERELKLFDERVMKDLVSFVRVDNQRIAEHAEGAHDDFVFALAIATSSEVRTQGASYAEFEATPEQGPVVSEVTGY
jgi:hypothetical protein